METPETGDKIIKPNEGLGYHYASVNHNKGAFNENAQFFIIEGYRQSTKELLNNLLEDEDIDWLKIDSKIYPILYLFRHYLEITLKDTIRCYNILNGNSQFNQVGYERGHSLMPLWSSLKEILENRYESYDESLKGEILDKNNAVGNILNEIETYDKDSFGFRYPYHGAKRINESIKYVMEDTFTIDLNNLKDIITKMINYFEGVNSEVIAFLDEKYSNN